MPDRDFAAEWARQPLNTVTLPGDNHLRLMSDVDPLLMARYVDAANDAEMGTQASMALFDEVLFGLIIPEDHPALEAALARTGSEYIGMSRRADLIEHCIAVISGRPFENASTTSPGPATPPSTTASTDISASPQGAVMPTPLRRSAP